MTKAHRLLDRKQELAPTGGPVPVNFLLGCSETSLANFELGSDSQK